MRTTAHMIELPDYDAIETEMASYGYTIEGWCREAKIATSTWRRWRNGDYYPSVSALMQIESALKRVRKKNAKEVAA